MAACSTVINGDLPYLLTLASDHNGPADEDYVEFLFGGTLTPIPSRNCIPFELLKQVAVEFLNTGNRSQVVSWEEI